MEQRIQFVKLYQNAADVIEKLEDPSIQRVTIIGAGYIGVELAEAFVRMGERLPWWTVRIILPFCLLRSAIL